MKKTPYSQIIVIGLMIAATFTALALSNASPTIPNPPDTPPVQSTDDTRVTVSGQLIQNKISKGGDGTAAMSLTLTAADILSETTEARRPVDMVIVLDRSGSMEGQKIEDARSALQRLIETLTPGDRLGLVTYSSGVACHSGLVPLTNDNRRRLLQVVRAIRAGGGTNLGAGLQTGINTMRSADGRERTGKLILISDGLANEGVTDTADLSRMAAGAREHGFSVSTIGVGNDFNEILLTAIADNGTGQYHYLATPGAIAGIFEDEFRKTGATVASALEVRIPLTDGIVLQDANGYPVQVENGVARFFPGTLRSGQSRTLYLTLKVPTAAEKTFRIQDLSVRYTADDTAREIRLNGPFELACVADEADAMASIKKDSWVRKVLVDDYNRLKDQVAKSIKAGNKREAIHRIEEYRTRQQAINQVVQAEEVEANLDRDLNELKTAVDESFSAPPAAAADVQNRRAKELQFDAYKGRKAN